jgi:NAD(P)-dependent dehydrogenase (short-subunit alcohol dehydrogenase family)
MSLDFEQQTVLITGGNRGLGRAFSKCLAAAGAEVIIHSSGRDNSGQELTREIISEGGRAHNLPMPLEDGAKLISASLAKTSRLDAVVHSAGMLRDFSIGNLEQSDWDQVISMHLTAAYQLTKAVWSTFREQGFGRLVFISSAAGLYGNFGQANYAAAKMGLYGLCNTVAIEGEKHGISANTVAPWGATDMNRKQMNEDLRSRVRAEQVAPLVAYLCHPECQESGSLFEAGAGRFKKMRWESSRGLALNPGTNPSIDDIASGWNELIDFSISEHPAHITDALARLLDR